MSKMFKIFVGNLSFKTGVEEIRAMFAPYLDQIEDIVIARDPKTDKHLGYGFVLTPDAIKGRAAIRRMGKPFVEGRLIYLKEAHGKKKGFKPSRPPRPRVHRPRRAPRDRGSAPGPSLNPPPGSTDGPPKSDSGYTGVDPKPEN